MIATSPPAMAIGPSRSSNSSQASNAVTGGTR